MTQLRDAGPFLTILRKSSEIIDFRGFSLRIAFITLAKQFLNLPSHIHPDFLIIPFYCVFIYLHRLSNCALTGNFRMLPPIGIDGFLLADPARDGIRVPALLDGLDLHLLTPAELLFLSFSQSLSLPRTASD